MKVCSYIVRWQPIDNALLPPEKSVECDEERVVRWEDFLGWNGEEGDGGCFEALVAFKEAELVEHSAPNILVLKRGMEVIMEGVEKLIEKARKDWMEWEDRFKIESEEGNDEVTASKFSVGDVVRLKSGGAFYDYMGEPLRNMKVESAWRVKTNGVIGWRYFVTIMGIEGMSDEIRDCVESKGFDLGEEQLEMSEE